MKNQKIKLTLFINGTNEGSEQITFKNLKKGTIQKRIKRKYHAIFGAEAKIEFDQSSGAVFIDMPQQEAFDM